MKRASERFQHGSSLAELNITPLLDLVFVLLIIFMITANSDVLEQDMEVNLPKGNPEKVAREIDPKSLNALTVDAGGQVHLNRKVVPIDSLGAELAAIKARNPEATVSLRADSKLPYQQIFRVLEALKEAEMKFGLANTPEDK